MKAFFAPVVPVAQAESIRRLETSPFTKLARSDAFRLLGLPDQGSGTALLNLLTRAIDELEAQKKVHLSWSVSDQDRLDTLIAQRKKPVLMPYLVRATGYDLTYANFSIMRCGDTIWLASRSPNIPDTTVKRFPLVIFLEGPPTNLYLTRGVLGKNLSR